MKVAITMLAAGVLTGGAPLLGAELANGIKAVVHDAVITYQEFEGLNAQTADLLVRQYRSQREVLEQKLNEMQKENLQKLRDWQLILHEFKTAGYNLPESVIDDQVQERIRSEFGDRATLTKTLEARGMTYEKFRQQVRERFIVEQMRLKNVSSEIIVSPYKIGAYYQAHQDEFKIEDQVKLRAIVLKAAEDTGAATVQLAEEIRAKLKEGASFAQMASVYSQGSQGNQGGDWGWWERSQLTKGLADIAFLLPTNQCSGVFSRSAGDDYWVVQYEQGQPTLGRHYGVEGETRKQKLLEERRLTEAGGTTNLPPAREFYLMLVEEAKPAHFKPLAEVRDQIEKTLLLEERSRLEKQWIERLKKKTFVVYF